LSPLVGWLMAALLTFFAWRIYGLAGLALAASATVFWLLLQFGRAMRVMKNAAGRPVGHVASAVMFQARLRPGMTMLQVVAMTKSLGTKLGEGDDDWAWADEGGNAVRLHFEKGRLRTWTLERPPAGEADAAA
jgi:hypothetical protein